MTRKSMRLIAAALLVALIAACTPSGAAVSPSRPITDAALLNETEWWLAEVGREAVGDAGEPPIDLRFFAAGPDREQNEFGGYAGCNHFGGTFVLEAGEPVFPQVDRTRMACESGDEVRAREEAIFMALESATGLRLAPDGRLEVMDADGTVRLVYRPKPAPEVDAALAGTEWELIVLHGQPPLERTRLTLNFDTVDDNRRSISGSAGCNGYGGEIRVIDDGVFNVPEIGRTEAACGEPEGIMEQENAFIEALANATAYRVEADRLQLLNEAGEVALVFARNVEQSVDPAALIGTEWRLVAVDGQPPDAGRDITLVFHDEHRYSGQAECRSYVGSYQAGENDIWFSSSSMLGEACEDEGLYLPPNGDYQLGAETLEISGEPGGTYTYERLPDSADAPLEETNWLLLAFIGPSGQPNEVQEVVPGSSVTAEFLGGTVSGSGGCNGYGTYYDVEALLDVGRQALSEITQMDCQTPEGVMEQEAQYWQWVQAIVSVTVSGQQLWVTVEGDRALLFVVSPDESEAAAGDLGDVTTTPAPSIPSMRVHTAADVRAYYDAWPDAQKLAIDEDVLVIFTFPHPTFEWVGGAIIYHALSFSSIHLDFEGNMDERYAQFESEEGRERLEAVVGDEALMAELKERVVENWGQRVEGGPSQ